jgi:hypothetical protein
MNRFHCKIDLFDEVAGNAINEGISPVRGFHQAFGPSFLASFD